MRNVHRRRNADLFATGPEGVTGRRWVRPRSTACSAPQPEKFDALKRALESVIPTNTALTNYEVGIDLPGKGPTALAVSVRQIASALRTYPMILLSLHPR